MRRAVLLTAATVLIAAPHAGAQVCGDPDGNRRVDVVDGANVGRAAVGLASACTLAVCDVDGSGTIDVLDTARVRREAVNLSASLSCGAAISGIFQEVERTAGVADQRLDLGFAPVPGGTQTLGTPVGRTTVEAGTTATYSIDYEIPGDEDGTLIIAVRDDATGDLLDGFFELDLPASQGTAEFQLRTSPNGIGRLVTVEFLTRSDVAVSAITPTDLVFSMDFFIEVPPVCSDDPFTSCQSDAQCPQSFCPGVQSCAGGSNDRATCASNADCPGGTCRVAVACFGGGDEDALCQVDADCEGGECPVARRCDDPPREGAPCTTDALCEGAACRSAFQQCVGGARAGKLCDVDANCPGGFCPDDVGCDGGANDDRACAFNSECPGGVCVPD